MQIIVSPFFTSQGGVAECKAVYNMGVLMDAYLRADNMVACYLATNVQGTGKKLVWLMLYRGTYGQS